MEGWFFERCAMKIIARNGSVTFYKIPEEGPHHKGAPARLYPNGCTMWFAQGCPGESLRMDGRRPFKSTGHYDLRGYREPTQWGGWNGWGLIDQEWEGLNS